MDATFPRRRASSTTLLFAAGGEESMQMPVGGNAVIVAAKNKHVCEHVCRCHTDSVVDSQCRGCVGVFVYCQADAGGAAAIVVAAGEGE